MRTLCKQASVCSVILLNRHVLHHTVCVSLCIYMYAHTQTHTKHAPIASLGGGGGGGRGYSTDTQIQDEQPLGYSSEKMVTTEESNRQPSHTHLLIISPPLLTVMVLSL